MATAAVSLPANDVRSALSQIDTNGRRLSKSNLSPLTTSHNDDSKLKDQHKPNDDTEDKKHESLSKTEDSEKKSKDSYTALLEKRLEFLEKQFEERKKKDEKKDDDSDSESDTESDKDDDEVDKDQTLEIKSFDNVEEYRKVKCKTGVTKGPVIVTFNAFKGFGTGTLTDASESQDAVPYRVAIQSNALLKHLSKLSKLPISNNNTFLRPFKFLLFYGDIIRNDLARMEAETELDEYDASHPPKNGIKDDVDSADNATDQKQEDGKESKKKNNNKKSKKNKDTLEESDITKRARLREHMRLLVTFMDSQMSDIFQLRKGLDDAKVTEVSFEDLWHVFRPGQIVLSKKVAENAPQRAYRVLQVIGGRSMMSIDNKWKQETKLDSDLYDYLPDQGPLEAKKVLPFKNRMTPVQIDCCYIDYDGKYYGPKSVRFVILQYTGKKLPIHQLDVYPIQFDVDQEAAKATLLSRGARFLECTQIKYMRYAGRNIPDKWATVDAEEVHCECVIDSQHVLHDNFEFGDRLVAEPSQVDNREFADIVTCGIKNCNECTDLFFDSSVDGEAREAFFDTDEGTALMIPTQTPNQDQQLLLPLKLYGYALADRKWHALNVINFHTIEHVNAGEAFQDLVLDRKHKFIIQALVKNQIRKLTPSMDPDDIRPRTNPTLDLIRGKGQGLVIMLHGAPGTGKTSTAEAIASQLKSPLFPITCGDLGSRPADVEDKLEEYFKLAQRWGCVLLLDEADVFLARRSAGDQERNGLVSVFLRALEYYSGVLILTTNRVGELDEAFRSRIHVSLHYDVLSQESSAKIWELNLRRIKDNPDIDIDIEEAEIREFYKKKWDEDSSRVSRRWNGRQIKNAFQTALAMANWEFYEPDSKKTQRPRPLLTAKQFTFVAGISNDFDDYLDETHKANLSEMAQINKTRVDNYSSVDLKAAAKAVEATPTRRRGTAAAASAAAQPPAAATTDDKKAKIQELEDMLAFIEQNRSMSAEDKANKVLEYQFKIFKLRGSTASSGNNLTTATPDESDDRPPWAYES